MIKAILLVIKVVNECILKGGNGGDKNKTASSDEEAAEYIQT
jgi:hypothetical protein